jgi:lipoprotein NlpI
VHLFIKSVISPLLFAACLLTQGCTLLKNDESNDTHSIMNQMVIAEPLPISYKSEIAIARLSEVIQRVKITDAQRAELFYDRGVLYDSVGLRSLARLDFSHALQLKPTLVDAYNFLGIHLTQVQEFSQAYEQFDSALDLEPTHEYAYLNRGIALYYGGRPQLAALDFKSFHSKKKDDPYRLLWLYLTEYKIDVELAKKSLKERSQFVSDRTWAKQVIYLYLGDISQQNFISELTKGVTSNKELTDRLCEAYFYLGKYNQMLGYLNASANFFKLSLSTNVYEFVEHRYAKLELDLMRRSKVQDKEKPSENKE